MDKNVMNQRILLDNPAERLLSIIESLTRFGKPEHRGALSVDIWCKLLNSERAAEKFFPLYAMLPALVNDAYESVIQHYPRQKDSHKAWHRHLQEGFTKYSPYHHKWADVYAHFSAANVFQMLQIASDNLAHYVKVRESTDDSKLKELIEEIDKLIDEVNACEEMSLSLRDFLIRELRKIRHYLEHYSLYGFTPIKDGIYDIAFNVELNAKPLKKGVSSKLIVILGGILLAFQFVNEGTEAIESLEKIQKTFNRGVDLLEHHIPKQDVDTSNDGTNRRNGDVIDGELA